MDARTKDGTHAEEATALTTGLWGTGQAHSLLGDSRQQRGGGPHSGRGEGVWEGRERVASRSLLHQRGSALPSAGQVGCPDLKAAVSGPAQAGDGGRVRLWEPEPGPGHPEEAALRALEGGCACGVG